MNKEQAIKLLFTKLDITGSRFMNMKNPMVVPTNPSTDWDFVVAKSDPILTEVLDTFQKYSVEMEFSGYVPGNLDGNYLNKTSSYQTTQSTVGVIKLFDGDINIIIKADDIFEKYVKVFDQMTPEFYAKYIWKSSPENKKVPKDEILAKIRERIELLLAF